MLMYLDRVRSNVEAFEQKVRWIAQQLGINPNWLMLVMWIESRLNPIAENPITGATGLIQFMPSTALAYGTSVEALRKMSNLQQLDYVYKYLRVYKNRMKTFVDTYLAVFFPVAMGQAQDFIIHARNLSAEQVAKANKIYDLNLDGHITVAEIRDSLAKFIPASFVGDFGIKKKEL